LLKRVRDDVTPDELQSARDLLARLDKEGIGALDTIKAIRSELFALLLPGAWDASPERLQVFISHAELLRAWQAQHGYREEARRTYMLLMKARRRWLWREGMSHGRLGLALRSWLYYIAELFTGYGEGLGRWFVSSFIMIYLFGFGFILADYLSVTNRSMPIFDSGGSSAGMYFYLSFVSFLGLGFRVLQFDDFLGAFLVDMEFLIGKLMLIALVAIIIRKFLKQNS
jgi:hypothetical protein